MLSGGSHRRGVMSPYGESEGSERGAWLGRGVTLGQGEVSYVIYNTDITSAVSLRVMLDARCLQKHTVG